MVIYTSRNKKKQQITAKRKKEKNKTQQQNKAYKKKTKQKIVFHKICITNQNKFDSFNKQLLFSILISLNAINDCLVFATNG